MKAYGIQTVINRFLQYPLKAAPPPPHTYNCLVTVGDRKSET